LDRGSIGSLLRCNLSGEPVDKGCKGNVTFDLVAPRIDTDCSVLNIALADYKYEGQLLALRSANSIAECLVCIGNFHSKPRPAQLRCDLMRVVGMGL
jgi:hypothetical protein